MIVIHVHKFIDLIIYFTVDGECLLRITDLERLGGYSYIFDLAVCGGDTLIVPVHGTKSIRFYKVVLKSNY